MQRYITMSTTVDIEPSELAEMFANAGDDEQAQFINMVGKFFGLPAFNSESQICSIANNLDQDGLNFVYTLANFAKARNMECGSPKEHTLINTYPDPVPVQHGLDKNGKPFYQQKLPGY